MQLPNDLRHFNRADYEDGFQLIAPSLAVKLLLVVCLLTWAIEPVIGR